MSSFLSFRHPFAPRLRSPKTLVVSCLPPHPLAEKSLPFRQGTFRQGALSFGLKTVIDLGELAFDERRTLAATRWANTVRDSDSPVI